MHTMSVSWQNWMCGQSLVAYGRNKLKKQQQNSIIYLKELTDSEMRIFRGMAFQICGEAWKCDDLL